MHLSRTKGGIFSADCHATGAVVRRAFEAAGVRELQVTEQFLADRDLTDAARKLCDALAVYDFFLVTMSIGNDGHHLVFRRTQTGDAVALDALVET